MYSTSQKNGWTRTLVASSQANTRTRTLHGNSVRLFASKDTQFRKWRKEAIAVLVSQHDPSIEVMTRCVAIGFLVGQTIDTRSFSRLTRLLLAKPVLP